ncbi:hypothetical protein IOLA_230 [uncultured bacterium]|nr:hypothetical protein IOLA_230 [uncultured bacterium]
MKMHRPEMISKQLMRVINTVLIESTDIFDMHNFKYGTKLSSGDVNIIKINTHNGIRSSTVFYHINSIDSNDKNFILFNKHRFINHIKKKLKTKFCPYIVFKYDSHFVNNCLNLY